MTISEGDCYPRSFAVDTFFPLTGESYSGELFHFYVKEGTLDNWDMYTLNDNFAHMGDVTVVGNNVAFVGSSVKSLSDKAYKEKEQVFIQIFKPKADLSKKSSYITSGKRTGLSGENGRTKVTDYGVKFLTNTKDIISSPQVVSNGKNKIVVMYEKYNPKTYECIGVYYQVLNKNGKVIKKEKRYSKTALLNYCETPVYSNGYAYWVYSAEDGKIRICSIKI